MENILKINSEGIRAEIALELGITPQGLASRLNADVVRFLTEFTSAVRRRRPLAALSIYADIRARLEGRLFPVKKKWSLVEVVGAWQAIFLGELEYPGGNRFELLQKWRELAALGNLRIVELTETLEGKSRFGFA